MTKLPTTQTGWLRALYRFVRSKPADEHFNWANGHTCALAQFARHISDGYGGLVGVNSFYLAGGIEVVLPGPFATWTGIISTCTFGGMASAMRRAGLTGYGRGAK